MSSSLFHASPAVALIAAATPALLPLYPVPVIAQAASDGPRWKTPPRPTSRDYPRDALRQNISGRVAVRCEVVPDGRPANCVAKSETQFAGHGFGEAAIRIVSRARLNPETIRPDDLGTTFVVTVPFS